MVFQLRQFSLSPSSGLRAASPLKGEAVTCAKSADFTVSPLRGEAGRSPDEGDTNLFKIFSIAFHGYVGGSTVGRVMKA